MLAGDVNSIHRIWSFLDHWGLINFLPSDEEPPKPLPVIQAAGMPAGTRVMAAPAAPANLFGFKNPTPQEAATAATTGGSLATIMTRPDRYGYTAATPTSKQRNQFFCNADTSHDCTRVRYHCTKLPDVDICPECYADGRLPIGMTSRDFIRIDNLGPEVPSPPLFTHTCTRAHGYTHTHTHTRTHAYTHSYPHLLVFRLPA
jgi:SWI/SNF related-matrix-associated actin-dependent regulator of chromatin subfamily C